MDHHTQPPQKGVQIRDGGAVLGSRGTEGTTVSWEPLGVLIKWLELVLESARLGHGYTQELADRGFTQRRQLPSHLL